MLQQRWRNVKVIFPQELNKTQPSAGKSSVPQPPSSSLLFWACPRNLLSLFCSCILDLKISASLIILEYSVSSEVQPGIPAPCSQPYPSTSSVHYIIPSLWPQCPSPHSISLLCLGQWGQRGFLAGFCCRIDKAYPKKWELNFPSFSLGQAVTCPVFSISHYWGELVHKILQDFQGGKQLRAGTVRFSQGEDTSAVTEFCFLRNPGQKGQAEALTV